MRCGVIWCFMMFIYVYMNPYMMLLYVIVCYCFPLCPRPSGCTEVAQVLTTQHHQFAFQRHQGPSKKFRTVTSILQCLELPETWATCKIYICHVWVYLHVQLHIDLELCKHLHTHIIYMCARMRYSVTQTYMHVLIYVIINLFSTCT